MVFMIVVKGKSVVVLIVICRFMIIIMLWLLFVLCVVSVVKVSVMMLIRYRISFGMFRLCCNCMFMMIEMLMMFVISLVMVIGCSFLEYSV